jgi:hypothetical protein
MTARAPLGCVIAALTALCGCEPCGEELAKDERYQVDVLDGYGPGGRFTFAGQYPDRPPLAACAGFDGVASGATLEFTTTGAASEDGCRSLSAEVTAAPAGLRLEPFSAWVAGIMSAFQPGAVGDCAGTWIFILYKTSPDSVFQRPAPGHPPSVVMRRQFVLPRSGPCDSCDDYFVVSMSRKR